MDKENDISIDELAAIDFLQLLLKKFEPYIDETHVQFEYDRQIERIGSARSLDEAIFFFRNSSPAVQTYKFVFSSAAGTTPGFSVNKNFSKTAAVRSLFPNEKVFVIDSKTLAQMENGPATFRIDYSISLDNQALSYLDPFFENKLSRIPDDMLEVFEFISRPEVFVDPQPYMNENLHNLHSNEDIAKIRDRLRAYEVLRTLDLEELKRSQAITTILSPKKLETNTHKLVAEMFKRRKNKRFIKNMAIRYLMIYCLLLKMISIQLRSPQRSTKNKLLDFLKFCHTDLKALSFREISLAKRYFDFGQSFKFFEKIQKNRDALFQSITGMVWDLYHIRQLEEDMVMASKGEVRYFFPAILSFDKGLNEVMDLHQLKSIAFCKSLNKTVPFYYGDFINDITDNNHDSKEAMSYFFEREQIESRDATRVKDNSYLQKLALSLEIELEEISCIKRPKTLSSWYMLKA